jgi:hypothetical protein
MINLVGFFLGPDDQKCFLWVLLGFVVWGSKKLFLGVLTKNNFFFCKLLTMANILRIQKKNSKKSDFLMGLSSKGLKKRKKHGGGSKIR